MANIPYDDALVRQSIAQNVPDNNEQLVKPENIRIPMLAALDFQKKSLQEMQDQVNAVSLNDLVGTYNAATGAYLLPKTNESGTIVLTPQPVFTEGKTLECTVPGTNNIPANGTIWNVGDNLVSAENKWYRIPYSDLALMNQNGSKVQDSGSITSIDVPEIQYQHVRGEAEMIGDVNSISSVVASIAMYEQLTEAVIFNKVRLYVRMTTPAVVTARVYKSSILRTNMSNATLLAEKVIPLGSFNVDPLGFQEITFDQNLRVKSGEFVYIGLATDGAQKLGWRTWNVAAESAPARHGYLYTPEIANPWAVNMSVSSVPTLGQAAFELSKDNSSDKSKKSFEKTKHFSVNDNTGRMIGVSIPSIQYQNARGNSELIGNANFSGATYYGYGLYERLINGASFNTIDLYMRVLSPAAVSMRIYSGKSVGSSLIIANQKLLYTKEYVSGEFNSVEAISTIKLPDFIHIEPGDYIYIMFYCSSPGVLQSKRFTSDSASAPFRHSYLVLNDTVGVPSNPWGTWAYTSIGSGFYGTSFKLYMSDDNSNLNARMTEAEAKIAANTAAIGNALTKNTDGSMTGVFSPEIQYQHVRGASEMLGNAAFSNSPGLGWVLQMAKDTVFNKLELPLYVVRGYGNINVRIYKGSEANSAPSAMTLLQSIDILGRNFNRITNGSATQSVSFDYPILLKANEFLHVYTYCDVASTLAIRYFTTESGTAPLRGRFKHRTGTDPWAAAWTDSAGSYYAAAIRLSLVDNNSELRINSLEDNNPRLVIPSQIRAIVGYQLSVYYDQIVLGKDAGLQSPSNYFVVISCEKGVVKERYWRLESTTVAGDTGTFPFTVSVYDIKRNLLIQKTVSLIISAATKPVVQKYTVDEGDSTISDSNSRVAINEDFNAISTGLNPLFLGTAGSGTTKSEAFGGSRFIGHISEIMGITGGTRPNSLWNPNTNSLDVAYYKNTVLGHSGNIDQVNIQLGINDSRGALKTEAEVLTIIDQSKTLINAWLTLPDTKIIIHLPLLDVNVLYAGDKVNYQRNLWRLRELIVLTYDEFVYNPRVYVGQGGICVDRYFGYRVTSNAVGRRYPELEYTHTDNVHPRAEGYKEMGDAKFAQILSILNS